LGLKIKSKTNLIVEYFKSHKQGILSDASFTSTL
jgi:hypothetical protein